MENNIALPESGLSESWFSQGKNWAKLIVGALLGIGAVYLFGTYVLPWLVTFAWDLEKLIIAAAAIGASLFFLSIVWQRIGYIYEAILELTLGWVVDFDPFVISRHQIEDKEKDRELLNVESKKVEGKKIELQEQITTEQQKLSKGQATILELKSRLQRPNLSDDDKDDLNGQLQLQVRNFGRSQEFITTVTPYLQDLSKISAFAKKAYKLSGFAIEDAKQELQTQQAIYSAVNSGERALQNAVKAFRGNSQTNKDAEFALNRIRQKVGLKVANIHNCIDITSQYMNAIDLNNAVEAREIMAKIDNFNVEKAFGDDVDSKAALASSSGHFMSDVKVSKEDKYADLIS